MNGDWQLQLTVRGILDLWGERREGKFKLVFMVSSGTFPCVSGSSLHSLCKMAEESFHFHTSSLCKPLIFSDFRVCFYNYLNVKRIQSNISNLWLSSTGIWHIWVPFLPPSFPPSLSLFLRNATTQIHLHTVGIPLTSSEVISPQSKCVPFPSALLCSHLCLHLLVHYYLYF